MAKITQYRYCLCGSAMRVSSTPPDLADQLAAQWDSRHAGDGHGPATQREAAAARRREEARALAADNGDAT